MKPIRNINKGLKISFFSLLFFLFSFFSYSQQYEWKWAMSGGGLNGGYGDEQGDECIHDVKVGTDNNYYFIAAVIGKAEVKLNGQPLTVYNGNNTFPDILLFSTTSQGELRWSQAIGGGSVDNAFNLVLDEQNNVYIGANVRNNYIMQGGHPVHFSPNDSIDYPDTNNSHLPQDGYKTTFLVKYDSNGNFIKKVALQGDVSGSHFFSSVYDLAISDDGKLHFMIGLTKGTHLDGNAIVLNDDVSIYQYFIAQYDLNLEYVNSFVLPITYGTGFSTGQGMRFAYDKSKHQYYIAGIRGGINNPPQPLIYEEKAFVERSFILAIDDTNGNEKWRREIYSKDANPTYRPSNCIFSMFIDDDSNIYVGGSLSTRYFDRQIKIYDPTDESVPAYWYPTETTGVVPMIAKLKSDGTVLWVQSTAGFAAGPAGQIARYGRGIAVNQNEVAFATQGTNEFWDTILMPRPEYHAPDPILVRFNKETGEVIAINDIYGDMGGFAGMSIVAVDKDGNYITGGFFRGNIFMGNTSGITPLISTGEADFFIAKLEKTIPCVASFPIPFLETFTESSNSLECWSIIDKNNDGDHNTGGGLWKINTTEGLAEYMANQSNAGEDWLISPKINVTSNASLKFNYKTSTSAEEKFSLFIIPDNPANTDNAIELLASTLVQNNSWATIDDISLVNYIGQEIYIGIKCESDANMGNFSIKDFEIFIETKNAFSINSTVDGGNGSVTPATQMVNAGANIELIISPSEGYVLKELTDNGSDKTSAVLSNKYTISNIQENHNIVLEFKLSGNSSGSYSLVAAVFGGNGSISPASQTVNAGDNFEFSITPNDHYILDNLKDNNLLKTDHVADGKYKLSNIQENHNIVVKFKLDNSISEESIQDVKLYPNPTNDMLNIEVSEEITQIEILTIDGKFADKQRVKASKYQYNTKKLVEGNYIVKIYTEKAISIRQFSVKR